MWWFLAIVVLAQLYFVRELLAAFALFALVFAVIAGVIVSLYMAHKVWEVAVVKVAESSHPVVQYAKRSVNNVEELAKRGVSATEDIARRSLRRPGSATAR